MQSIKLNLIPGSVLPVVNVSQYDAHRQFSLSVYEGATAYDLTGKTVEIRGTKPDGNGFAYDATDGVVSVSGNTVTISTKEQMTAVGGQTMAELRITSGTTILGTLNFVLDVEPSALSNDTPISGTEIPAIERQLEEIIDEIEVYSGDAEAWAAGTRDGVPVPASDPAYHNNSKYYKDEASTAATTATTKAGEAATSATNAGNSATTAYNAATTATTKAGEASTSATNAGLSETAASNSATAAAADSLEAEGFAVGEQNGTPVGPDSPYYHNNAAYYAQEAGQHASGGIIFKGSLAFADLPTVGMANGDEYNITDDFTTDSRFIEGAGLSVKAGTNIAWVAGNTNKWDILATGGGGVGDAETATGNPLSFTTDSEQVASNTIVTFEPIQVGSGDPSPSNVRPIYGYDSNNIKVSKKNIWSYGNVSGTKSVVTRFNVPLQPGTYTISFIATSSDTEANTCRFYLIDKTEQVALAYDYATRDSRYSYTFTLSDIAYGIVMDASDSNAHSTGDTFSFTDIQIEYGSTATTYEPYNPVTDITIKLNETLYGGTLDVESGKLVVTHKAVDMGSMTWGYSDSTFTSSIKDGVFDSNVDFLCEIYKPDTSGSNNTIAINRVNKVLYAHDSNYSSASTFKTAVTGKKIVYELATPITILLPPAQVKLLQGANTVITNGVSLSLTYRKGEVTKLSDLGGLADSINSIQPIQQKVAGLQKTGCVNVAPNKATSQVISGVTFTENTNGSVGMVGTNSGGNINYLLSELTPVAGEYALVKNPTPNCYLVAQALRNGSHVKNIITLAGDETKGTAVIDYDGYDTVRLVAWIQSGLAVDTTITYMLTPDLSATYADIQPYSMTNRELTEAVTDVVTGVSTNGWISFYKVGKVCTCKIIANAVTLASGEAVGNIPDEFLPVTDALQMIEAVSMRMFSISKNSKTITTNHAYNNVNIRATQTWVCE